MALGGKDAVRKVTVPNIIGMTRTNAAAACAAVGLSYVASSSTTTSNSAIDQQIITQSLSAGSVVILPNTVSTTYYQYVYPGFGFYGGFGFYTSFGFYAGFGFFGFQPFTYVPENADLIGRDIALGGQSASLGQISQPMCIHKDTQIKTTEGFKSIKDINVGDQLASLDIFELPSNPGQYNWETWKTSDFLIAGSMETTVLSIKKVTLDGIIKINGDSFSTMHPIFIKRENEYRIVRSSEVTQTDLILGTESQKWEPITEYIFENVEQEDFYSIITEPSQIFFTKNLAVHSKYM